MKEIITSAHIVYRTKSAYFFSGEINSEEAIELYRKADLKAETPLNDLVRQVRDSASRTGCYMPAYAPDRSLILVQLGDVTEFAGATVTSSNSVTL